MKTFGFQRGQFLVAGIVLIVVIALMIATLGYLYVSGESASTLHGQSERAYFAARSGIEYSSGQYFNGSACSSLNNANVAVGGAAATFTLTPTPTLYAPLTLTGTTAALTAASASIPVTSIGRWAWTSLFGLFPAGCLSSIFHSPFSPFRKPLRINIYENHLP